MDRKSLSKRLKKQLMMRAMKYISTPEGLANMQRIFRAKKSADQAMSRFYHFIGLPNRGDKRQVDWIIERQNRRLRDLTENLAGVEKTLDDLEATLADKPATSSAEIAPQTEPVQAVRPKAAAKAAPAKKKPAAPAVKRPAATTKAATKKPSRPAALPKAAGKKPAAKPAAGKAASPVATLGAVNKGAKLTGGRNLLDLDFRKKSRKTKKNK